MDIETLPKRTCSQCKQEKETCDFYKKEAKCRACRQIIRTKAEREKSIKKGKTQKLYTLLSRELRSQGLKHCPGCKTNKTFESFYKSKASYDGLAPHCIICASILAKNRQEKDRSKRQKAYKETELERKNKRLQKKFGISLEIYEKMLIAQGGVCAICHGTDENKRLAVDHDHKTGEIRQLLCGRCNPAMGFLGDNAERARQIASYLERHVNNGVSKNSESL